MHVVVRLSILLLAVGLAACELPQNKSKTASDATVVEGDAGDHTWHYLSIVDNTSVAASDGMPGADIDAIVILHEGEFLFAGCTEVTLLGEDNITHGENPFIDPSKATLGVREQTKTGGFLSLAGGTLLCELPLSVVSGDEITVWEIPGDATDSFSVTFATEATGGESQTLGPYEGTVTLTVP